MGGLTHDPIATMSQQQQAATTVSQLMGQHYRSLDEAQYDVSISRGRDPAQAEQPHNYALGMGDKTHDKLFNEAKDLSNSLKDPVDQQAEIQNRKCIEVLKDFEAQPDTVLHNEVETLLNACEDGQGESGCTKRTALEWIESYVGTVLDKIKKSVELEATVFMAKVRYGSGKEAGKNTTPAPSAYSLEEIDVRALWNKPAVATILNLLQACGFDSCAKCSISDCRGDFITLDTSDEVCNTVTVTGVGGTVRCLGRGIMVITVHSSKDGTYLLIDPDAIYIAPAGDENSPIRVISANAMERYGVFVNKTAEQDADGRFTYKTELHDSFTNMRLPLQKQEGITVVGTVKRDSRNYQNNKLLMHHYLPLLKERRVSGLVCINTIDHVIANARRAVVCKRNTNMNTNPNPDKNNDIDHMGKEFGTKRVRCLGGCFEYRRDKMTPCLTEGCNLRGIEIPFCLQAKAAAMLSKSGMKSQWSSRRVRFETIKEETEDEVEVERAGLAKKQRLDSYHGKEKAKYVACQVAKANGTGDTLKRPTLTRYNMNTNGSIDSIKQRIQDVDGHRPDEQKLVYAGRVLEGGRTLADYNISGSSTALLKGKILQVKTANERNARLCGNTNMEVACGGMSIENNHVDTPRPTSPSPSPCIFDTPSPTESEFNVFGRFSPNSDKDFQ